MDTPIQRASDSAGSQRALADKVGVTPAAVNQWITGNRPVPEDRCPTIEQATNGAVTCEELRPDITWVRIPDDKWPNHKGRPLVDHSAKTSREAA